MKRFLTLLPALALAVVLTGLLACSGGDDDGGQLPMYTPVPIAAEINGLVRLEETNVRSGSPTITNYPAGAEIAVYAVDNPDGKPLAESQVRSDSSYSLPVTVYSGTVVYLYLRDTGAAWYKVGAPVIDRANVRYDIREAVKRVTIQGTTSGYTDGSSPSTYTVAIVNGDTYSPTKVLGSDPIAARATYSIDIQVPAATATYSIFINSPTPVKVGTVEVRSDVSGDITKDISYTRNITLINGNIAYKVNGVNTQYGDYIVAGSAATLSWDTVIGFGGPGGTGTPTPYYAAITRPTAPTTVYFFVLGSASGSDPFEDAVLLGSVDVAANAPSATKDLTYTVTNYSTTISGTLSYKENGVNADISIYGPNSIDIVDAEDNTVGSVTIGGSVGAYTYTASVSRETSSITVYFVLGGLVKSDPVTITGTTSITKNLAFDLTGSAINGEIGGSGKSALGSMSIKVYDKDINADDAKQIGFATISPPSISGGPYTYTGKILRPEAPVKAYYYVRDNLGNYYKIGEKDLEAGKLVYTHDFIIGLVNKRIVPAL
jgi:hypothetical protein